MSAGDLIEEVREDVLLCCDKEIEEKDSQPKRWELLDM